MSTVVSKEFFACSTTKLAANLIGCYLAHRCAQGYTVGRIVETEAYLAKGDPACHAAKGLTKRNAPMFGPAGTAYVYLIYGMYHCFNVVSASEGCAEAVLIRALEPVAGLELMAQRRDTHDKHKLCRGPGCLTVAMGIDTSHNRLDLRKSALHILPRDAFASDEKAERIQIARGTRIGISEAQDLLLRYCMRDSHYLSRKI